MSRSSFMGIEKFKSKLRKLPDDITAGLKEEIQRGAEMIAEDIISGARAGKHGRVYTIRRAKASETPDGWTTINGKTFPYMERETPHQASAPGEPIAEDVGKFTKSVKVSKGNRGLIGDVLGPGIIKLWEYGTQGEPARPTISPAVKKNGRTIQKNITKKLNKVIKHVR